MLWSYNELANVPQPIVINQRRAFSVGKGLVSIAWFWSAATEVATAEAPQGDTSRDTPPALAQPYAYQDQNPLKPGDSFESPPEGSLPIQHGGTSYWVSDGIWFRADQGRVIVINPPVEFLVRRLPPGTTEVTIEQTPYYYSSSTWYLQFGRHGYAIVDPPPGHDAFFDVKAPPRAIGGPTIYPLHGQSAARQAQDTMECLNQTMPNGGGGTSEAFHQLLRVCMEARGYGEH